MVRRGSTGALPAYRTAPGLQVFRLSRQLPWQLSRANPAVSDAWPTCLAAQHRQLMPKHHDLQLLEALRTRAQEHELLAGSATPSKPSDQNTSNSSDQHDGPPTLRTSRNLRAP